MMMEAYNSIYTKNQINSKMERFNGFRLYCKHITLDFETEYSGWYQTYYKFENPVIILSVMGFVGDWVFNPIGFGNTNNHEVYAFLSPHKGTCNNVEVIYMLRDYVDFV